MPTLQVLEREPDQRTELLYKMGENLSNALLEKRKMKIYEAQIDAMKRNATSEEAKLNFERYKDFVVSAHKLKELGGGAPALIALSKIYGNDMYPYLENYAKDLADFELKENPIDAAIAERIRRDIPPEPNKVPGSVNKVPISVGVGMDGQPDTNPMVKAMLQYAQPTSPTADQVENGTPRSGIRFKGMSGGRPQIEFYDLDFDAAQKRNEVLASKGAELEVNKQAASDVFEGGMVTFDDTVKTALGGSTGETGFEAWTKGGLAKASAAWDPTMQKVAGYEQARNALSAAMVRALSGAQANQMEIKGIQEAIPSTMFSDGVNDVLKEYWRRQFSLKGVLRPQQIINQGVLVGSFMKEAMQEVKEGKRTMAQVESGLRELMDGIGGM